MFELEVSDLRSDKHIEQQTKELKSDIIDFIDSCTDNDIFIEDEIIKFINDNRLHCLLELNRYKAEINKNLNCDIFSSALEWEECDDYMIKYSEKYPYLLFKLIYKPKNPYDAWIKYYKNGQVQDCNARYVIDPFDENKLK